MKQSATLALLALLSVHSAISGQLVAAQAGGQPPQPANGDPNQVRVGIPFIVDMNLQRQNGTQSKNTALDLGILGGLIRVNLDRTRDHSTGRRTGPINVSIFGQKIYGERRRRRR